MSKVEIKKKSRRDGDTMYWIAGDDSSTLVIGRDYALQNQIDETRQATISRSCFKGCRTCGKCANSERDSLYPKSYDSNSGEWIDCRGCEPFSFHDCHNGVMRNSRQEPEPFTPDQQKLLDDTGGKPLI